MLKDFVVTLVSEEPRRKTEITCVIVRQWVFAESSEKASRARVLRSPRRPPMALLISLLYIGRGQPGLPCMDAIYRVFGASV